MHHSLCLLYLVTFCYCIRAGNLFRFKSFKWSESQVVWSWPTSSFKVQGSPRTPHHQCSHASKTQIAHRYILSLRQDSGSESHLTTVGLHGCSACNMRSSSSSWLPHYMLYSKELLGPSKWKYAKMHMKSYNLIIYCIPWHTTSAYFILDTSIGSRYSSEIFRTWCRNDHKHGPTSTQIVVLSTTRYIDIVGCAQVSDHTGTNVASVHILLPRRVQLNDLLQILVGDVASWSSSGKRRIL